MTTDFQNIRREVRTDGVCVLTFDRRDSVANIFDTRTFEELNAHLDFLEHQTQHGPVQGVIFISAKGKIFIAGADLHGFTSGPMTDERLGGIIDNGHRTFARIAKLPVPTVAAIQGVCVGGGLELTLACDWRVACNDSAHQARAAGSADRHPARVGRLGAAAPAGRVAQGAGNYPHRQATRGRSREESRAGGRHRLSRGNAFHGGKAWSSAASVPRRARR